MIKLYDSNLSLLAYLEEYNNPSIMERINGDYVFSFVAVIDGEKSEYIAIGNIVEADGQYFNIVHHRRMRNRDGSLMVQVDCEQVTYDLIDHQLDNFIQAGTPADILAFLLSGTGFTIGSVYLTDIISVSINETTNKRAVLVAIAAACGGELGFDKYSISLFTQRGQNRGVQWRVGKNIAGITKDVDKRSGALKIAYEIDIVELNSLEEYAGLEYFELGDTIKIIDPDIGVNEDQRIVEYEYDPRLRMNSRVTIANFVAGIQDSIVKIHQTTVVKDKVYNGTRIGPENGFEAIRSDNLARTVMNATEGIKIQKGNGTGSSWVDVIYLDLDGNAFFTGKIEASDFVGGTIAIGSGNDIFIADENGIYLGHVTFASAPFSVNMDGKLIATNAEITGKVTASDGVIGGWIIGTTKLSSGASYPKVELDSSGKLFSAYLDASHSLRIDPNVGGAPAVGFYDPSGLTGYLYGNSGIGLLALINDVELTSLSGSIAVTSEAGTIPDLVASINSLNSSISTLTTAISSKVNSGSNTSTASTHDHGIPAGTLLAISGGGSVSWVPSGSHSHTV